MKTYILNLLDSASARLTYHSTFLEEVSIICEIPMDTDCVKVVGTIDFKTVIFDKKFYDSFKGEIDILDLSELKSSSSYNFLRLGLNDGSRYRHAKWKNIKEIILPCELNSMPMIRNLPELRKIVGVGLETFNNESRTDYIGSSNLSNCPKLEEIIFGSNIKNISIRNSSIKRINIPKSNGLLQLEPYGLAYNKELEEVNIPQDMRVLPIRLFEGCERLRKITGGNGLEEIGFGAFGGCVNLYSVPFRIELLNENQFVSYDGWMQYEPEDHKTSRWIHGDCAHCPKGVWSEESHEWDSGCNYSIKNYCRDNELRKWKPYKKGVVLKNGYIWCFDDFTYYKTNLYNKWRGESINAHKYVEFISPNIMFTSEEDHVNINYSPQEKSILEISFPQNKLAEMIELYFEEISYEVILDEITRKIDELDIDAIIDSYETIFRYENFKMGSDSEGERYELDRSAQYTDEYLVKLLPPIHEYYDDRTACVVRSPDCINPYKKKFDLEQCVSTYGKNEEKLLSCSYFSSGNIFRDVDNLKNNDEKIRKEAREKYNRKDHVNFLVNCRISEIINKKMEIEARLHIKQAENEFDDQSR